MPLQQRLPILLLCLLFCAHKTQAETEHEKGFVLNAVPTALISAPNVKEMVELVGNSVTPSLFAYWQFHTAFFWQTGMEAHIIYGKNRQDQKIADVGLVSLYHGIMIRSNPDATKGGFYIMGAVRLGYVPHSQIMGIANKGSLYLGPMFSFGVETGKIGDRLGFIFDVLAFSPMYRIAEDESVYNSTSPQLTAASFMRIGVNWKF